MTLEQLIRATTALNAWYCYPDLTEPFDTEALGQMNRALQAPTVDEALVAFGIEPEPDDFYIPPSPCHETDRERMTAIRQALGVEVHRGPDQGHALGIAVFGGALIPGDSDRVD